MYVKKYKSMLPMSDMSSLRGKWGQHGKKNPQKSVGNVLLNLWTKIRPGDTRTENQDRVEDEGNKKWKERLCAEKIIYIKVSTVVSGTYITHS